MVVHLEHIQAVITAGEVLILNPTAEHVAPFVANLEATLSQQCTPMLTSPPASPASAGSDSAPLDTSANLRQDARPPRIDDIKSEGFLGAREIDPLFALNLTTVEEDMGVGEKGGEGGEGMDLLPFEFRVLELILETVLLFLERHTKQLERDAYPALEALTRGVSTDNLEVVRSIKSRLTRLTARVQKVREELEQLMDDDDDMRDLYLTRGATRVPESPVGTATSRTTRGMPGGAPHSLELNTSQGGGDDVEELEMLLEAYFMQVDGTLNKLTTLKEYIDDTEDYINAELDQHRNQLIQSKVILATAGTVAALFLCFLGCPSMNVPNAIYDSPTQAEFNDYVGSVVGGSGFGFIVLLVYLRWKGFIGV